MEPPANPARFKELWRLGLELVGDQAPLCGGTVGIVLGEGGCDEGGDDAPALLAGMGQQVAHEVDAAPRSSCAEDPGRGGLRGAPYHPQTQGKIERWHQTLKNRILLENYYLPGDLENQISAFVDHYNNQRYHESIGNVTPADAYFGRHTAIIEKRKRIKKLTTQTRRLNHQRQAA